MVTCAKDRSSIKTNEDSTLRLEPVVATVHRRLGNIMRFECLRSRKESQPLRCDALVFKINTVQLELKCKGSVS
jgi:hypothetical protein